MIRGCTCTFARPTSIYLCAYIIACATILVYSRLPTRIYINDCLRCVYVLPSLRDHHDSDHNALRVQVQLADWTSLIFIDSLLAK